MEEMLVARILGPQFCVITGTRYGFSLGSCDDGQSLIPRMTDDSDGKLFKNCSITNSVNFNVFDLLNLDSGIRNITLEAQYETSVMFLCHL